MKNDARSLALRCLAILLVLASQGIAQAAGSDTVSLEAEDGVLLNTIVTNASVGFSGKGYVTGFRNAGDLVRWKIETPGGPYHLLVHFRSPYGGKNFEGKINGSTFGGTFPKTARFATLDAGSVRLVSGNNILEIGGGSGWFEIDRVDLIPFPLPLPVPTTLADPQATPATKMLMRKLADDYGKHTWSGQHDALDIPFIEKASGRSPLVIEGDFVEYSPSRIAHGAMPTNYTESMIALAKAGHVLGFCWHWNAPTNLLDTKDQPWWRGFYTSGTKFDVAAALANTNSAEYALMLSDIDTIAVQLKKISDADIPLLWRPLHEAENRGFWWGAKGPGPFKQLWQLLFKRLTNHHGLHNLIWVLGSDGPHAAWYPGDDVVDIVGFDGYPKDRSDTLKPRWDALKARFDGKKMIALTEFGGVPDIDRMQNYGVWWSWFSTWSGEFGPYGPSSSPTNTVVRIYQSPAVITLDERR